MLKLKDITANIRKFISLSIRAEKKSALSAEILKNAKQNDDHFQNTPYKNDYTYYIYYIYLNL